MINLLNSTHRTGEPLRAETMRTGRHLIIASAICAVVVTFDVQLKGTGLVPLDFGNRSEVLAMLMALAVILLLLSFVLRTWTDLLRERETAKLVTHYIEDERVDAARKSAEGADAEALRSQREALEGPEYYDQEDSNWDAYVCDLQVMDIRQRTLQSTLLLVMTFPAAAGFSGRTSDKGWRMMAPRGLGARPV
ncbi:hypothetical protein ABIA00_003261 [Bradyrhizobium ottawaense]|uniref:hypothetical protein n=1 Tax=Bradyrhizobium ottawaense TaxID=931866 RepID=UPI003834ED55